MKQITLKIYKLNLLLGIALAILLIIFVKYYKTYPQNTTSQLSANINNSLKNTVNIESFLSNPISKISSLCKIQYNTSTIQPTAPPPKLNINIKAPTAPTINLKPTAPTPGVTRSTLKPNISNTCKLGININPPSQTAQQAIITLTTPITPDQVNTFEEILTTIPDFINVFNSPRKEEIIKAIIIVNKLVSDPNITLNQSDIDHIVTVIISDINTVDPQIASTMVGYYSESDPVPETNIFTNLVIPVPDIELNTDAIQIITSEPIIPLTPESEQLIAELFKKIKKDIPYDDCIDILTGRKRAN